MTVSLRSRNNPDGTDGYDSAVRFIRDLYRKGSLRTEGLDVVMEDAEQDVSLSSMRSSCSGRVRKAQTYGCLASLNAGGDDDTSRINGVGEEKKRKLLPSASEEDSTWGFFIDDDRDADQGFFRSTRGKQSLQTRVNSL